MSMKQLLRSLSVTCCTMAPTAENPDLLRCEIIFPEIFLFDRREQESHSSCDLISQAFNQPAPKITLSEVGSGAVRTTRSSSLNAHACKRIQLFVAASLDSL
jgi:hypothetical protein